MSTPEPEAATVKPKTGRRAQRLVTLFDRSKLEAGSGFRTSTGATYGVAKDGAFVRTDKDHRNAKERKRARREARKGAA